MTETLYSELLSRSESIFEGHRGIQSVVNHCRTLLLKAKKYKNKEVVRDALVAEIYKL